MVKPKENPQVSVISQEGTDWMNKVDSLLRIVLLVSLYQGFTVCPQAALFCGAQNQKAAKRASSSNLI